MTIERFVLVLFLLVVLLLSTGLSAEICQSGLREDNTNYIYCARQNLTQMPNFLHGGQQQHQQQQIASNVLYDELVLTDNLISTLTGFNGIKAKKVYLERNPLRRIAANAFEQVRNYLEEIYFELPSNPTSSTSEQEEEEEEENDQEKNINLDIFSEPLLQKCSNLRVLSIHRYTSSRGNGGELKANLLLKLNKLEVLSLAGNGISRVAKEALAGLELSLQELTLSNNRLESIPNEALQPLRRLRRLNLAQNRIKSIAANCFFQMKSPLHTLDLSYNSIRQVDASAFSGPVQNALRTLLLQNNELKLAHLINLLFNLHQLLELNIDFNKLSSASLLAEYHQAKFDYHRNYTAIELKLNVLSMQGNGLTASSLNSLLASHAYSSLVYDDDDDDEIDSTSLSLPATLRRPNTLKRFHLCGLLRLNLARNKISEIPVQLFSTMSKLSELSLDRNPLSFARSDTFTGLENSLTSLNLNNLSPSPKTSTAKISTQNLIDSLNRLRRIEILELNNNNRLHLTAPLYLPITLRSLELQGNKLEQLPTNLCQMSRLSHLDLASNRLRSFSSTFLDCLLFTTPTTTTYSNSSSQISRSSKILKLTKLNLNNNPLNCDCNLRPLKQWLSSPLNSDMRDLLEFIQWECVEPVQLAGRYLSGVELNELDCVTSNSISSSFSLTSTVAIRVSTHSILYEEEQEKQEEGEEDPNLIFSPSSSSTILITLGSNQPRQMNTSTTTTATEATLVKTITSPNNETLSFHFNQHGDGSFLGQNRASGGLNLSFYSLVIGISMTVSTLCLLTLVLLYSLCLKQAASDKNKQPINYINSYLSTDSKYKNQLLFPTHSPLSSATSMFAHTTVVNSLSSSSSSSSYIECNNNSNNKTNELLLQSTNDLFFKVLSDNAFSHHYPNVNYNNLNYDHDSSLFSQAYQPIKQQKHHIYHEINSQQHNHPNTTNIDYCLYDEKQTNNNSNLNPISHYYMSTSLHYPTCFTKPTTNMAASRNKFDYNCLNFLNNNNNNNNTSLAKKLSIPTLTEAVEVEAICDKLNNSLIV